MNWILNLRRRLLREERGVAMVEFALVAPLLFIVLFGMLDFGKAINYWNTETQMAAQGARLAAVNGSNALSAALPCVGGGTKSTVADYIQCQTSTGELRNGSGGTFGATAAEVCIVPSVQVNGTNVGRPIIVKVTTHYTWIPLFGLDVGTIPITATATMRTEQNWVGGNASTTGATCP